MNAAQQGPSVPVISQCWAGPLSRPRRVPVPTARLHGRIFGDVPCEPGLGPRLLALPPLACCQPVAGLPVRRMHTVLTSSVGAFPRRPASSTHACNRYFFTPRGLHRLPSLRASVHGSTGPWRPSTSLLCFRRRAAAARVCLEGGGLSRSCRAALWPHALAQGASPGPHRTCLPPWPVPGARRSPPGQEPCGILAPALPPSARPKAAQPSSLISRGRAPPLAALRLGGAWPNGRQHRGALQGERSAPGAASAPLDAPPTHTTSIPPTPCRLPWQSPTSPTPGSPPLP